LTQERRSPVIGLEARNQIEVIRFAGIRATLMEAGRGQAVIDPILPHHRGGGSSDAVNGAIIAYLFDVGMGVALDSLYLGVPLDKHRVTTMDLAVSYVRPCYGDVCVCEAIVVGGGRRVVYARADVRDAEGTVCAQALGTYRVWPGGPQVHPLPGPPPPEYKVIREA
jgi:acyl-coenzyme A thioesterase PaaI-like protein